ncbi:MAG: GNAT family N-acetyltransferase [Eubacterium sp.]
MNKIIRPCTMEHIVRYGEIYAAAFSGEPWNDPWKPEKAQVHVKEILESSHSYGLEYALDEKVVGLLLGTSMLFHFGRTFEINDLAVDPQYQGRGIASKLLDRCLADMKAQGIAAVHLITASEGKLPVYYEKHGFKKENGLILMGMDL